MSNELLVHCNPLLFANEAQALIEKLSNESSGILIPEGKDIREYLTEMSLDFSVKPQQALQDSVCEKKNGWQIALLFLSARRGLIRDFSFAINDGNLEVVLDMAAPLHTFTIGVSSSKKELQEKVWHIKPWLN